MFAGPLGRSTFTPPKSSFDSPLYGLVSLRRSHLLESGADLRTIQLLMGHVDIEATTVYLHLSQKHLQAAANPLDQLTVSSTARIERSRRRHKPA